MPSGPKAPKLIDEIGVVAARNLFGGSRSFLVVALLLAIPVLLNLFSNALWERVQHQLWIVYLAFALLIVILCLAVRRVASRVELVVLQEHDPQPCRALIIFLSPPAPADASTVLELCQKPEFRGMICDESVRSRMRGSWRMPLEAVAHHKTRLKQVVVIPSANAPDKQDGTFTKVDDFSRLLLSLCDGGLQVRALADLLKVRSGQDGISEPQVEDWRKGVDFEDADALVKAITAAYAALNAEGLKDYDVMVDVTGGQKPPSIAGAAVSLVRGDRRFQYVSTRDYKIRSYDITFVEAH